MPTKRWFAGAIVLALSSSPLAGEFDRIEGERLGSLISEGLVEPRQALTMSDVEAIPLAFKESRAAFLIVKTGEGNVARLLISFGFRKPAAADGVPIPVIIVERFDTFAPGRTGSRPARGVNLVLFEGFPLDLDSGQVVPEGQGGDVLLRPGGKKGAQLESLGGATIFVPKRLLPAEPGRGGPSPGNTVVPGDFAGRYRLRSDGRWSGTLDLTVDGRVVKGSFRSEANGNAYPVAGEVAADVANRVTFDISFPRSEQSYEGYLWTEGKSTIAGSFRMLDRPFGFVAIREGATLDSKD